MNLADRGGGQRFLIEGLKEFFRELPGLGFEYLPDLRIGKRGDLILEFGEFLNEGQRNQIGSGGENLAQLDKSRPQFFQRQPEPLWAGQNLNLLALFPMQLLKTQFNQLLDLQGVEKFPEAVFEEDLQYLSVAANMMVGTLDAG